MTYEIGKTYRFVVEGTVVEKTQQAVKTWQSQLSFLDIRSHEEIELSLKRDDLIVSYSQIDALPPGAVIASDLYQVPWTRVANGWSNGRGAIRDDGSWFDVKHGMYRAVFLPVKR